MLKLGPHLEDTGQCCPVFEWCVGHRLSDAPKPPNSPDPREDTLLQAYLEAKVDWKRFHRQFELDDDCEHILVELLESLDREREILSLLWAQVDLVERVVKLDPGTTKNDEGRTVPLDGELYEALAFQRQVWDERYPDCPWIFFRDGQPIGKDFREPWAKEAKAAATRKDRPVATLWDSERERPAKLFHDLRRTGVRNLVRAGVPERVAMLISGHKSRSVFDRYNVVSERDIRDAGRKLTEYLCSKDEHESRDAGSTHIHKAHRDLSKTLN